MTSHLTLFVTASLLVSPAVWPRDDSISDSVETKIARQPEPGLVQIDDLEYALIEAKLALDVAEKQLVPADGKLFAYTLNYGDTLLRSSKLKESRRVLTLALSRGVDAFGAKSEEIVPVLFSLADANAGLGNLKTQRKHLRRAAGIVGKTYGKKSLQYADAALTAGAAIVESTTIIRRSGAPMVGRYGILEINSAHPSFILKSPDVSTSRLGRAYLRNAKKLFAISPDDHRSKIGTASYYLGRIAMDEHRHADALELFGTALETLPEIITGSTRQYGTVIKDLECLEYLYPRAISSSIRDKLLEFKNENKVELTETLQSNSYVPIKRPPPYYPSEAADRNQSGYVDLMYTVSERGKPTDLRILYSCNRGLFDISALQAARKFEYSALMADGVPVAVPNVKSRISFRISR